MGKWLPVVIASVIAAMVGGYYALTEPVTAVHRMPLDSTVLRNPYHAAQAWLQQRQQPSERILSAAALFPLPDNTRVLVFDKRRGLMTDSQVSQLLEWVETGGELIVAARPLPENRDEASASEQQWQDNDPLLYPLGITVWRLEDEDEFQELEEDPLIAVLATMPLFAGDPLRYCMDSDNDDLRESCVSLFCDAPEQPEPLLLHGEGSERDRYIQLYSDHVLWHDSWDEEDDIAPHRQWPTEVTGWADNEHGSQLIQLSLGDGQITVLSDLSLWDNDHLLYFDHAWLLGWLTGDSPVWFVRSVEMPPLVQWLWRRAPELISALAILLGLWLWYRIPRQGPLHPANDGDHHDYLQHLHASGYFQWRTRQHAALLRDLRKQAGSVLNRLHPDPDTAFTLAGRRLDTRAEQIRLALYGDPESREHLLQTVQLLQTIRSLS